MGKRNKNKYIETGSQESEVYTASFDFKKLEMSNKYTEIKPNNVVDLTTISNILKNSMDWANYKKLLELTAYFTKYDNMLFGAFFNILIPFAQSNYRLIGGNANSRKVFKEWLTTIGFEDILAGLAHDYFVYGRSVCYLYDSGALQVLPIFRCQVESLDVLNNPVISFEVDKTRRSSKVDIKQLESKYAGFPSEILDAAKQGKDFALLETSNTFSISGSKASWEKYSLPIITSALPWLYKKDVLSLTENTELSNMSKSFLEVQVGDEKIRAKPNENEFKAVANSYSNAIKTKGNNISVVAWNVKSEWKVYNNKDVLNSIANSMSFINWNILSALSMSPVLSAGSEHFNKGSSGSFSQTSSAVKVINKRINTFLKEVAKMINRMMKIVSEEQRISSSRTPELVFDMVDLENDSSLNEELISLYDKGLLSRQTLFDHTDLDYEQEKENKTSEVDDNEVFAPPAQSYNMSANDTNSSGDNKGGAPIKDNKKRKSDKEQSLKNQVPSPSDE